MIKNPILIAFGDAARNINERDSKSQHMKECILRLARSNEAYSHLEDTEHMKEYSRAKCDAYLSAFGA